jgi:hypothetical protein
MVVNFQNLGESKSTLVDIDLQFTNANGSADNVEGLNFQHQVTNITA